MNRWNLSDWKVWSFLFVFLSFLSSFLALLFLSGRLFRLLLFWLNFFLFSLFFLFFRFFLLSLGSLLRLDGFLRSLLLLLILLWFLLLLLWLLFFLLWGWFCLLNLFRLLLFFSCRLWCLIRYFGNLLCFLYDLDWGCFWLLDCLWCFNYLIFCGFRLRFILCYFGWKWFISWVWLLIFGICWLIIICIFIQLLMPFKKFLGLLCSFTCQSILIEDFCGKPLNKLSFIGKEDNKSPSKKKEQGKLFKSTKRTLTHWVGESLS